MESDDSEPPTATSANPIPPDTTGIPPESESTQEDADVSPGEGIPPENESKQEDTDESPGEGIPPESESKLEDTDESPGVGIRGDASADAGRKSRLPGLGRKSRFNGPAETEAEPVSNKRRRTSLLGNLMAGGRMSRGLSFQRMKFHLTPEQRQKQKETPLPPEDYYLWEDLDAFGVLLEKPEALPGENFLQQFANLVPPRSPTTPPPPLTGEEEEQKEPQERGNTPVPPLTEEDAVITQPAQPPRPSSICPPPVEEKPASPPEHAVYPVARNTVELQSKLVVYRNLRTYVKDNNVDEGKCYYGEDEVDLSFLTSKPVTFLIFGKPGIGRTTLAAKLADKLHSVHLNPERVIEYFRGREPLTQVKVNETLENGESISDSVVIQLLGKRIQEFDILHRGYVLEGFPLVTSDDLPVYEQLESLSKLAIPPEYLIIMQMQDKDLYKRRLNQKLDPVTGKIYTQAQYSKFDPDELVFDRNYRASIHSHHNPDAAVAPSPTGTPTSDAALTEDLSDTEKGVTQTEAKKSRLSTPEDERLSPMEIDFPKIPAEVVERLFYRTEDFNVIVNDDLDSYRYNFTELQEFVQEFNKRKTLEVDAYWSPTVIFQRVWEYCEAMGIQPVPVPVQIMRPMSLLYFKKLKSEGRGEVEDDDDDDDDEDDDEELGEMEEDYTEPPCVDDDALPETNWSSAIRAVAVRGLVDPRFRWRIPRWGNICPVALKQGRSLPGKPELAVSFMDKVFFLSSKHAVDQFINNPRPYLLPKMPTSPVKFVVIGHPLAGKTTFAHELAALTDGTVVDIEREIKRRFADVKRDIIWKKRLKYALEATHLINVENHLRWQRQERTRRRDMHAWIENYLKAIAEAEIAAALERDKEMLHKLRQELRKASEFHAMGEPFGGDGLCQPVEAGVHFNWRKFITDAFGGKKEWAHQELLELAWELFHARRLFYRRKHRDSVNFTMFDELDSEDSDEEFGLVGGLKKGSQSRESSEERTASLDEDEDSELEDDDDDDNDQSEADADLEEARRRARRSRRQKLKKKPVKCKVVVKPVEPEDVLEPFLFDTFDVDPEDPEVEESVRMRFPMIPFELVDIVPAPPLVGDVDPMVQRIVEEKLMKDNAELDTIPPEIFVEILKRATTDVEVKYKKKNKRGPMSGGWVIENFPVDIEKWRATLRTPQICPDQVFLLLDLTEANMTIWSRFKKLYKLLHPPKPEPVPKSPKASTPPDADVVDVMDRQLEQIPGEDGGRKRRGSKRTSQGLPGEGVDLEAKSSPYGAGGGGDPNTTENETEQEEGDREVDEKSLELVSKSHFILSLLPRDDLIDLISMTSSENDMIARDLHRVQTTAFSDIDSMDDFMKTMEGHEKYIMESAEKVFPVSEGGSYDSFDLEEYENATARKFKPIYVEMSACIEEVDAFQDHHIQVEGLHMISSGTEITKTVMKNPPGTPEETVHPEPEDFSVPVPPEIERGEVELTPEENELKIELEDEIRRLSMRDDDYIRTPSEMGSVINIPGSAESGASILFQRLRSARIDSPKRKFFAQVRLFNEFWNMALPVCNQQGVRYWEVGLCDEETAMEKSIFIFNELESRFDPKAKKILETELKEEDEEVVDSVMKWGEPYDLNDIRFRPATKPYSSSRETSGTDEDDDDDNDDDEDEDDDEEDSQREKRKKEKDDLANLENKPDEYWKAVKRLEAERCFGDFKYYCPVTFHDLRLLRKGSPKFACKYKDRLYYCSDENNQLRFLINPKPFLPHGGPPNPPPPRICITGSPGCLQEEIASQVCNEFKVCYVNFRQRLHEIMKARFGRDIGPDKTGKIESIEKTEKIVSLSRATDDMLVYPDDVAPRVNSEDSGVGVHFIDAPGPPPPPPVEKPESERKESEAATDLSYQPLLPDGSGILELIQSQEILDQERQNSLQESALKSLGLLSQTNIETVPLNSIDRTERLTERKWERLTRIETYIRGFLENGIHLPDDVLDEFIAPLWREAPFTEVGFVLVGFPNTDSDVQYMIKRHFIPEHVFVMECKSIVIRNRLIVPTVDRWHKEQNPTGVRKRRLTRRSNDMKSRLARARLGIDPKENENEVFQYQVEGRPEVDEYEHETWTYSDALSRDIARALRYYHGIYSSGLGKMKRGLNKERICWTPIDTNIGLHQGKHKVLDSITPMLKYRNNVFEDSVRLSFNAAQALLDRGVFSLSRLGRWCPVELSKGNTGINIWNAPGVKKIPYLHRRFIYFLAGEKSAQHFEENTWNLTNQVPPLLPVPLVCMILGPPKSGKTTLAKKMSQKLGLLYVSALEAVEHVITHSFVTQWAQVLSEVNPALGSSGHQPMTLSNELLEYIREGRSIPRFLVYRCLDLFLMSPKAQCHGVVFDDFPTIIDELIELNYREMSPCITLDLKIPITEAYARCDRNRAKEITNDSIPEEGNDCIDYSWDQYDHATVDTFRWFAEEYQNIHMVDGEPNPELVYQKAAEICMNGQRKIQEYLLNLFYGKPNTLEGTCPLTSTLFHRLTPDFGFFCPVALNDHDELVSVREISDLSQVVEYQRQIYLFSSKLAVRKFMANPKRYTVPGCLRTPPKDIPQTLDVAQQDFERLQDHWGFMDFDPVLYHANHHYKGLQRGNPKYCVVYRGKLYVFINEENQKKFLRKPSKYWNLLLPMKIPRKAEPINYDKVTPFSYLSAKGMIPMARKLIKLMAEKRPRGPFMNIDQCAALYMGYFLKSQNMTSSFERRQKYRDAMFKMSSLKTTTRDFLHELQNYYGCRSRNLPDRLKNQLNEFLKFEHLPIEEKVYIPKIPGVSLGYDAVEAPFDEAQVGRKVRRMMDNMKQVEHKEKLEAFSVFSRRKKAAEEAAVRAAQDAQEAAVLAQKMQERSQLRMNKKSSHRRMMRSMTSSSATSGQDSSLSVETF